MSGRKIRNILQKKVSGQISKAKIQIREESSKQISKVKERVPSKDKIQKDLSSDSCSKKAQDKITKIYDRIYSILDQLERLMHRGIEKFSSIKNRINKIIHKYLPAIGKIIEFMLKTIVPALIAVEIAAQIALALPAKYTTGTFIDKLIEKKKEARDKRKMNQKEGKGFGKCISKYLEKAQKIIKILLAVVAAYNIVYQMVKKLKMLAVFLYTNYISKCNTDNQSSHSSDGSINPNTLEQNILDLIDDQTSGKDDMEGINDKMSTLYNDLLEDLKKDGKILVVERLHNIEKHFNIQYKVITVPTA
jgi:hypothetical protein